ncbi:uncharacterized protein LOC119690148 [Teleopsis dalmanni]|uniref:uncharacterized protein LOC119690148 n=1 Tax=Teleopsis dalmanni TaxID=139649 RepID=UPI0018CE457B|nr:uncharacterized protein LOC119690148 [Teleopsis dalmanni]
MATSEDFFHSHREKIRSLLVVLHQENDDLMFFYTEGVRLQYELNSEVEKLENNIKQLLSGSQYLKSYAAIARASEAIKHVKKYYRHQMECTDSAIDFIVRSAQKDFSELLKEKINLKGNFEETVKYLKKFLRDEGYPYKKSVSSRLCVLQKTYIEDVCLINRRENILRTLFQELYYRGLDGVNKDGLLTNAEWYQTPFSEENFEYDDEQESATHGGITLPKMTDPDEILTDLCYLFDEKSKFHIAKQTSKRQYVSICRYMYKYSDNSSDISSEDSRRNSSDIDASDEDSDYFKHPK